MENRKLYASVLERFPECTERISLLLRSDAIFAEICSDYDELAQWLAAHGHDDCAPDPACLANRELLTELEGEILQALQATERDPPVGPVV